MQLPASLAGFRQDLRHAARLFARAPGFTLIAIVSIACGTGANVAMFSMADALLLRPLPILRPQELLVVGTRVGIGARMHTEASFPDYVDIRDHAHSFASLTALTWQSAGVSTSPDGVAVVRNVNFVTGNFFDVIGVPPALGRGFRADEDRVKGRDAVAVVSHGLWQVHYGGREDVIGSRIRVNGVDLTIVGVTPERFTGLAARTSPETVYLPMAMVPVVGYRAIRQLHDDRDLRVLAVRGRLKPGVSIGAAQAELTALGDNLARAYPETNRNRPMIVRTELDDRLNDRFDAGLVFLLTILSTAVLGVACANVAGLLASRAPLRQREMALRLSIGATRARLIRQLLSESVLLAFAGGLCGIAVGYVGVLLLRQFEYPTDLLIPPVFELDRRALGFSVLVAMASAFVFGIGPALRTTKLNLVETVRVGDVARRWWWGSLRGHVVALQVALSLVLVTIAGYALQVVHTIYAESPGFRTTQVAKVTVDTTFGHYTDAQAVAFFERATQEARRLPHVQSAAVSSSMPFWDAEVVRIDPEGYTVPAAAPPIAIWLSVVDEGYFETFGVPLVAGRAFAADDRADAPRVAIVNETAATRYWGARGALGGRFRVGGSDGPWVEVVGIARTSKYLYPIESPQPAVYLPFRQHPRGTMVILAHTSGDSAAQVAPLRALVRAIDDTLPVQDAQTMERFYEVRTTSIANLLVEMVGGIGAMGVGLTMVGLYGLVSYSVSRRTREIGIRMAIGASAIHVLRMILRQGMVPTWAGIPLGLLLCVATARFLPQLIPSAVPYDVRAFAVIVPAMVAVTLVAAYIPARRASRVNPTEALRHD